MTYRYSVPKEYIVLPITDQEMMEISIILVAPPKNSLELRIDDGVEILRHSTSNVNHLCRTGEAHSVTS